MALSSGVKRKEVKKSSYYVWFLGAKESRGLRGEEYIHPVVNYLTERESEVEPLKVTLQVSSKGLKIIQNVCRAQSGSKTKSEVTKHFIPDHSITCVIQESKPNEDIVACILLIYNPVSKCPVHVHAYRCDSVETAAILRQHLSALVDRPDNQRKFTELERRLQAKGLLPAQKRLSSEGRSIRTESDSSGGGSDKDIYALDERMSNLYDSLAAELREKLNNKRNHGPMLLPPKDYDTVHRMRGRMDNAEVRPSVQKNVAGNGQVKKNGGKEHKGSRSPGVEHDSSGKSSGIGSDEAPSSPTHERGSDPIPKKNIHDESSSDEEWERHRDPQAKTEGDMILVQSPHSPRRRLHSREEVGRRSPSPPSSMHPPSPKLPQYRERYYEGGTRNPGNNFHVLRQSSNGGATETTGIAKRAEDRSADHYVHSRQRQVYSPQHDGHPERQIRRTKSRNDKDNVQHSERDMGYGSRSDNEPYGSRDPLERGPPSMLVPHIPHPQLSHSRSQDRLATDDHPRRDKGGNGNYHRYRGDHEWANDSYEQERPVKSPLPPVVSAPPKQSPPDYNAPYREGYMPLPRIRRLDSGQSSMPSSGHYSSGHHRTPPAVAYQEIPDEKRYPGLDRETARVQHHYAAAPGRGREYDRGDYKRDSDWEPKERDGRFNYQKVPTSWHHESGGNAVHRQMAPYPKSSLSPERVATDKHKRSSGCQVEPSNEDKRFYRYSSSDPDYRPSGHRISATAGYHY